jgi:hypothetical protein
MSFTSSRQGVTRRQFLQRTALAAGALAMPHMLYAQSRKLGANDKLNIGVVGVMGKGQSDTDLCASENIVALCDVDEKGTAEQRAKYSKAKFYQDFREMLEKEKSLDAVIVATPDHLHAAIASMAIKMGKHVYCQKPLTRTVYEARLLRDLAKQHGVATQMGNQGSAEDGLRRAVEVIHSGIIGAVKQIHVWSNRPIWPQGIRRPPGEDPIPANLNWDLWLGPAPMRPYKTGVYHPFAWRGWFDFGTGALGDMACHTANMPFRAAKLGYPRLVELLDHSELNPDTYPKTSKIRFVFPPREGLPETEFFWYDGNPRDASQKPLRPPDDVTVAIREMMEKVPDSGCLLIGEKGQVFSPDDYGARFFLKLNDEKEFRNSPEHEAVKAVPVAIPRNEYRLPGSSAEGQPQRSDGDQRQKLEWIAACKGGPAPYSNFDIAAYLTEIILLGCVALRVGKRLDWDGPKMRATNAPEAAQFVRPPYRKGWKLA